MVGAFLLLARPRPGLLAGVAFWKVGTELLYPIAGASWWEFIERGGSYGAPLALAVLLGLDARGALGFRHATRAVGLAVALLACGAAAIPLHAQARTGDSALVAALRAGGLVLACRHGATDHEARDRGPDRASQRNLTDEGVRQAPAIGAAIRALGIPIGEGPA